MKQELANKEKTQHSSQVTPLVFTYEGAEEQNS